MSANGKFWQDVQKISKNTNYSPVQIGQIISKSPLSISFNGLTLSNSEGDKIYVNNLILDDIVSFDTANPITCSQGSISENHTPIINAIISWISDFHQRFIIDIGDYVAVQKLGNNTYIVLEKVQNV